MSTEIQNHSPDVLSRLRTFYIQNLSLAMMVFGKEKWLDQRISRSLMDARQEFSWNDPVGRELMSFESLIDLLPRLNVEKEPERVLKVLKTIQDKVMNPDENSLLGNKDIPFMAAKESTLLKRDLSSLSQREAPAEMSKQEELKRSLRHKTDLKVRLSLATQIIDEERKKTLLVTINNFISFLETDIRTRNEIAYTKRLALEASFPDKGTLEKLEVYQSKAEIYYNSDEHKKLLKNGHFDQAPEVIDFVAATFGFAWDNKPNTVRYILQS